MPIPPSDHSAVKPPQAVTKNGYRLHDNNTLQQIGRASCRERVEISVVEVTLKDTRWSQDTHSH